MQAKEYAKARKSFLRVIEIRRDHIQAYYGLATASAKLGQRDQARKYQERFSKALAEEKAAFTEWTRSQGERSVFAGERSKTAMVYIGAAGIYRKHGNMQQAERLRQRAAALDPNAMRRR
jgi:tetratricopeptide (TPR) repeat protein